MPDPCTAAAPSATPTTGTSRGILGLIQRTISKGFRESTKRLLAILAGGTLCTCTLALTGAAVYEAAMRGAVDPVLRDALLGMGLWTAALSGVAYRKPDATGATNG